MFCRAISTGSGRVVDVRYEVRQAIGGIDRRDVDVLRVSVRGDSPAALNGHQHSFASRPLWEVPGWAETRKTEVNHGIDVRPEMPVVSDVDRNREVIAHPRFESPFHADRLFAGRLIAVHTTISSQPRG